MPLYVASNDRLGRRWWRTAKVLELGLMALPEHRTKPASRLGSRRLRRHHELTARRSTPARSALVELTEKLLCFAGGNVSPWHYSFLHKLTLKRPTLNWTRHFAQLTERTVSHWIAM